MKQSKFEELFPISKTMSNYFKEIGYELSDRDKAILFYNEIHAPWPNSKSRQYLSILRDDTDDKQLIKEINERFEYEENLLKDFSNNTCKDSVYVLFFYEKFDNEFDIDSRYETCFDDYNKLKQYAIKSMNEHEDYVGFEVRKELLNPEKSYMRGWRVAIFDKQGELCLINFDESDFPEGVQNFDIDKTRIENSPTSFPCPFKDGQKVVDIHKHREGTIYLGDKTWDEFINWIHKLGGCDFFDSRITVDYSEEDEKGWIEHEHICPLFLDFV